MIIVFYGETGVVIDCCFFQANKWCTRGVDLLASQQIEKCHTLEGAERALTEVEDFIDTAKELKMNDPKEFRILFDSLITPDTKVN